MKFAMVGCGALGSYYGAKLCRAGEQVHFLLRSDYEAVQRQGVLIHSPDGDFQVRPLIAKAPEEIGVCDWVLIGLKTTANDQFARLLPPLIGRATAVVTLQNGLGNEEQLAALFGSEKILGGLCFVCLNRLKPGVIQHTAHGRIVLGEFQRRAQPRTHDLAALFCRAGVPCELTEDLERAHWEKLVWNIPFNGLGVAGAAGYDAVVTGQVTGGRALGPCLTTQDLLSDARWEKLVRELMMEVIDTANKLGLAISESTTETQISRTRAMGAYKASTLVDFERGQPLELNSLFNEPFRRAQRTGVATPRLAALCAVLQQLDDR
ncbi:MAG: 2-dehydropantoate 2-reductase [Verrucomicrobia bacterium]|nr:2-dehydropantoate 2-reductase [Verrucomicrobiota bacterium]